jgi:hypothetical protein
MKNRLLVLVLLTVGGCFPQFYPPATADAGSGSGGSGGSGGGGGSTGSGVGGVGSGSGNNGGSGGSGGGGGIGGSTGDMSTGSAPVAGDMASPTGNPNACIPPGTPTINGNHNQGQACLTCHNGTAAKLFYAAGTIYNGTGTPSPGVTVEINDGTTTVRIVSASSPPGAEGNFWTDTQLGASLKVRASSCPANQVMPGNASGDCNSCHGASNRIHVP